MQYFINPKAQLFSLYISHYVFTIKGARAFVYFSEREGHGKFIKLIGGWRLQIIDLRKLQIIDLRKLLFNPTKSPAVYMQQVGRAKRVVTGNEPLEISGVWIEEAAQVDRTALDSVMKTLKQKGE